MLHANYLPPSRADKRWLALWAETETTPPRRHAWIEDVLPPRQPRPHRFAAKYEELLEALERLWRAARPGITPRKTHLRERLILWLPAHGARPAPSPDLVRAGWAGSAPDDATATMSEETGLRLFRMTTVLLEPEAAATLLAGLPFGPDAMLTGDEATGMPELRLGCDLRFWSAAAAFALDLLARQQFVPGACELAEARGFSWTSSWASSAGSVLAGTWLAALGEPGVRERFEALCGAMPDLCRAVALPEDVDADEPRPPTAQSLLEDFLHATVNARIAAWLSQAGIWIQLPPQPQPSRFAYGSGVPHSSHSSHSYGSGAYATSGYYGGPRTSLGARWMQGLARPRQPLYLAMGEARLLLDGLRRWHAGLSAAGSPTFRLCFRLCPPGSPTADERAEEDEIGVNGHNGHGSPEAGATTLDLTRDAAWRLDYLLQARDDPSLLVPLDEIWHERGAVARFVDRRFDHPHEQVLAGLGQAAQIFPPLGYSLSERRPTSCRLSGAEAYLFLRDALPKLEAAGFGVLAPPWWKRAPLKPTLRLKLKGTEKTSTGLMGLGALVGYDYTVALGGAELSREELEQLVALKEPLVRLRGQWVELRPEQVEAALRFVEEHGGPSGTLSLGEALRVSLTGALDGDGAQAVELEEVSADGWIGDLLGRLRAGEAVGEVAQPEALHGTLRPYQLRGLGWMSFLSQYGLGACLADDMGLGKCCSLGSLISTPSGPKVIESFWEHELVQVQPDGEGGEWGELAQPILVHTFDGREITTVPVHRIYRQRISEPCMEVRLADGVRLGSTKRHRYLTPTGWKMAGELQPGDLVAVPAKTPHVGASSIPVEMAELMAWQLAEGDEGEPYHHGRLCNLELAVLDHVTSLAQQMGVKLPPIRRSTTSYYITTGRLYGLFKPWGYEWGHKSAGKRVPQSILEAPIESQRAFIQALFDAEGHVSKTHCELTMASEQVIYALQTMLRNFGVWARIRHVMKSATNGANIKRPYYTLTFGGNSVQRFAEQFKLRIAYKQEALERLAALPHNTNVEGVPTQAVVAAMQQRRIPLRSLGLRTVYEWQGMGRTLATSVATQLRDKGHPDLSERFEGLAAPGIYWCNVKEVSERHYEGYVYDLEVPETHNYVANGIITHNTAQFLALLLRMNEAGQLTRPALLVCPTSVVGNWEHEAARFAPSLRVLTHHGATRVGRTKAHAFAEEVTQYDLVLTTYSLLPRDEKTLAGIEWGVVALDEAQNIKNAEAKQSRSARKLRAPIRVALTGTPVENRLSELWSILDFLNPGYLGTEKRFRERFGVPIEQQHDAAAAQALQSLVRPFILRRLKTDPAVISDLPEKMEMREYCPLTREQVTLYEAVVRDGLRRLEDAESPMERRGVILAMLMKLKQVCNHPAHFLGDGSDLPGRSGKLTRLEELIEELLSEDDRALIFTQFTALGERLQPHLARRFGKEILYLHGGVPRRERVRMVERFQSADGAPLFLLSLKAGGTGLNLTAATHVIHFDRWWNPAVENQATDRAFRIGQTRNVQVRKLVCQGTLEERIDAMIEEKRGLAEQVIGAGEAWLTELSTAELRDLFSLRASALAE